MTPAETHQGGPSDPPTAPPMTIPAPGPIAAPTAPPLWKMPAARTPLKLESSTMFPILGAREVRAAPHRPEYALFWQTHETQPSALLPARKLFDRSGLTGPSCGRLPRRSAAAIPRQ